MSTIDLRGDRKSTASRAGTSTPSDRQRALVTTRHSPSGMSAFRSAMAVARSEARVVPSTWVTSSPNRPLSAPVGCRSTYSLMTGSQRLASSCEVLMVFWNAIARFTVWSGLGFICPVTRSRPGPRESGLAMASQQPSMDTTSSVRIFSPCSSSMALITLSARSPYSPLSTETIAT